MATTTKRQGAAAKTKTSGAQKAAAKPASIKARIGKAAPSKMASVKAAAHILDAAKGPRTVSHRKIKEAVEKVFRERTNARA